MLKLKGKNSKRLRKEQKGKMEKTLKRMEETRKQDSLFLRDVITKKLVWAESERKRFLDVMEKAKNKVLQLNGAIVVLKELKELKKED